MKKQKMCSKKSTKGFTLIELLVVVLIIGILAAIAIPQYQMAVGKSKFTTLKTMTKSIVESVQRYYLANNAYPKKTTDLDISFDGMQQTYVDSDQFNFSTSDNISCSVYIKDDAQIVCYRKIFSKTIEYHVNRETNKPIYCYAYSKNTSDIVNRLCQNETGKKQGNCNFTYHCSYLY